MNSTSLAPPSSWTLFRALVSIGVICSLLIVSVFQLTASTIKKNETKLLDQAIAAIFPNADTKIGYKQLENGQLKKLEQEAISEQQVFAIFNQKQQLLGYVIKAQGMGYQDTIQLLFGYSPQNETINGITILSSRETPGLGDRIGKDSKFLANFKQLTVKLTPDKIRLLHKIESAKPSTEKSPWQIDSISGATISSRAVTNIISINAAEWIPLLAKHVETINVGN